MKKSIDRLKDFNKQIKNTFGNDDINVSKIDAIDGNSLSEKELSENTTFFSKNFCTKSIIGCFLSHKKAWKTMLDDKFLDYSIIMEDDCKLKPLFKNKVLDILKEVSQKDKNWDFIYLGCFGPDDYDNMNSFHYLQTFFLYKINKHSNYPHDYPDKSSLLRIPDSPVGFHCYIIRKKCAEKLLKSMPLVTYHVDAEFLKETPKFNVYSSKEKIAYQESTVKSSLLSESKFPIVLNNIFEEFKDRDDITYGYYMNYPILKIRSFYLNIYFIIISLLFGLSFFTKRHLILYQLLLMFLVLEFYLKNDNMEIILIWIMLFTLQKITIDAFLRK
jgi:GR25 family glycosyltransferase involved in LPS biosynthesis